MQVKLVFTGGVRSGERTPWRTRMQLTNQKLLLWSRGGFHEPRIRVKGSAYLLTSLHFLCKIFLFTVLVTLAFQTIDRTTNKSYNTYQRNRVPWLENSVWHRSRYNVAHCHADIASICVQCKNIGLVGEYENRFPCFRNFLNVTYTSPG